MKFGVCFLLIFMFLGITSTVFGQYKPKSLEYEILDEVNSARKHSTWYAEKLRHRKTHMKGKVAYLANRLPFQTSEGISAINEAIEVLEMMKAVEVLAYSDDLAKAASAQLADLKENPDLGHTGKDGSSLSMRFKKFGIEGKAGENITYRDLTPTQVTISMLVDDGVASRQHRKNVLNPDYRYLGADCAAAKDSRYVCVVIFASKDPGKAGK